MRHSFSFKSTVNHPLTGAGIKYKSSDISSKKREGEKIGIPMDVLFKMIVEPPGIQAFGTLLVRLVTGKV